MFRWTGLTVTGDRRGMSVVSLKGVRMMKDKNYSTKGALRSISAARIRGPVLTCQRWPWLPARQMK